MYPKDGPYFSHTHLTENAFSDILSVSQGRRAEKPAFFVCSVFMGRTTYGNHERYHPEPAAAGAGHRRSFVYFRILAGLSQKGLRPLSGAGHHTQGTEQRDQIQPYFSVVPSLSIVVGLFVLIAVLGGLVGIFIIVMLPIGILTSYVLWKKGKIQVVDKEQKEK